MSLNSLHLMLTYRCDLACAHCFAWGAPTQTGTMTTKQVDRVLKQGRDLGTIGSVYFEGGEPFLSYEVLCRGVTLGKSFGWQTGIVSNGLWAVDRETADRFLAPLATALDQLFLSRDRYHGGPRQSLRVDHARASAERYGITVYEIAVGAAELGASDVGVGQLPPGESAVMFRGRAAARLARRAPHASWRRFDRCPHEALANPGRVHVDPLGYVHLCQGIALGNVFDTPLAKLFADYRPERHPIVGPLLDGGPIALAQRHAVPHDDAYADACHFCDAVRRQLRERFPELLVPDQMYGVGI